MAIFDKGLVQNLVADAIFYLVVLAVNRGLKLIEKKSRSRTTRYTQLRFIVVFTLWFSANIIYYSYPFPLPTLFFIISSLLLLWFNWKELSQFWNCGLLRADRKIADGLNYQKALQLCINQLDFLGIGASKLTRLPEFEQAIARCNRPNIPIRFLLTSPNNPLLIQAAKQKQVKPDEYQYRVRESLKKIADLKLNRNMNIEVRFYPSERQIDLPLFRLMFINDSLCLVSYNVFGEGEGSEFPQLHVRSFQEERDVLSFYYPYRVFFDRLWQDSIPWNFDVSKLDQ